ncbi:MAG: DUF6691 family protein [Myxococcota bacterium]|nr:DUF6691 family protein [Myxococcota bacterium]
MNKANLASGAVGLLFAFGLGLAGMTQPGKVVGFLDVTGDWDPSLALVMGGAALTFGVLYRLITRRQAPVLEPVFRLPTRSDIDLPLIAGSALFGLGWGLGGFCPGPGLVSVVSGALQPVVFVATMLLGMFLHSLWTERNAQPKQESSGAEPSPEQQRPERLERAPVEG